MIGQEDVVKRRESPVVWAVILHWQGKENTINCLNSLKNLDYANLQVLVIDNGSLDQAGPEIIKRFPDFTLIIHKDNLGFAGGANAGIKHALDNGAEWVWLVNNDTEVNADVLNLLIAEASSKDKVGAVSPMICTPDNGHDVASGRGVIDFAKAKTFLKDVVDNNKSVINCEWLSGCGLLLNAQALHQVGLFDERYFLYFEDTDLTYRLHCQGWACILVPQAIMKHLGNASTKGKLSSWRAYYYTRNRLLFFKTHAKGVNAAVSLMSIYAHMLRHSLVLPYRGESARNQLKAEHLGWRDYLAGQFGKATCLDWCQ